MQAVSAFLDRQAPTIKNGTFLYVLVFVLLSLAPVLFVERQAYPPDSAFFMSQVNHVIDAFRGEITWRQAAVIGVERPFVFQIPIAIVAMAVDIYSPDFYLLMYWLFYVVPVPFLIWRLCVVQGGKLDWYTSLLPLIFFADPAMSRLAGAAFFTEVPAFTLCFASFVFAYEVFTKKTVSSFALKIVLAAFLFVVGVASRPHTSLVTIVPAYGLFLLWAVWPLTREMWKKIAIYAGLVIMLGAVIAYATKLWIPMANSFSLAAAFKDTIWKYGNGAVEMGVSNVYGMRFGYYSLVTFVSFLALTLVSLLHIEKSKKGLALFLIFIGLTIYQILLWTFTLPINPRYTTLFVFFGIIFVALSPIAVAWRKFIAAGIIVLFALDGLWHMLPPTAGPAPLNMARMDLEKMATPHRSMWDSSLYSHMESNYDIPYRELGAAIDNYRTRHGLPQVRFFYVEPYGGRLRNIGLRFMFVTHRYSDPHFYALQGKINFLSDYISEMRNPDIYVDFSKRHLSGMTTADVVMLSDPKGRAIPAYVMGWFEDALLKDVFARKETRSIGLEKIQDFYVRDRLANYAPVEHAGLFAIVDRVAWQSYVRRFACKPEYGKFSMGYCHARVAVKTSPGSLDGETMAKKITLYREGSDGGHVLGVTLRDIDPRSIRRIFVHFVGNETCPFVGYDFDTTDIVGMESFRPIDDDTFQKILRCNYKIRTGVWDLLDHQEFSHKEYKKFRSKQKIAQ